MTVGTVVTVVSSDKNQATSTHTKKSCNLQKLINKFITNLPTDLTKVTKVTVVTVGTVVTVVSSEKNHTTSPQKKS